MYYDASGTMYNYSAAAGVVIDQLDRAEINVARGDLSQFMKLAWWAMSRIMYGARDLIRSGR